MALLEHYVRMENPRALPAAWLMDVAALHGNLSAVRLLHQYRPNIDLVRAALQSAVHSGCLDLVTWIVENADSAVRAAEIAAYCAVACGQMHVVRWLVEHACVSLPPCAFAHAARGGHLDALIFAASTIEYWQAAFATSAHGGGDLPAGDNELPRGNILTDIDSLGVLVFLDTHRLVPESSSALLLLHHCRRGNADVVDWLSARFQMHITQRELDAACGSGSLQLMQWILRQPGVVVGATAVRAAVATRSVGILALFFSIDRDWIALVAEMAMADDGDPAMAEWLRRRYSRYIARWREVVPAH
ncbi:hypothetical protein HK105_207648 [Polyrhizophydium stewartii]|uniref:Ankyrin repeat protein n=1 Tax=Polyrhizophydium stewartii TaxID=2732419 RepID=A0ABR4N010_9FUNG